MVLCSVKISSHCPFLTFIWHRADLYPPYFIQVPVEYTEYNDRSPLYELGDEAEVNIELNKPSDEIRIYTSQGYKNRLSELVEEGAPPKFTAPALIPFLPAREDSSEPVLDLSKNTEHRGSPFRVVVFDENSLRSTDVDVLVPPKVDIDAFQELVEEDELDIVQERIQVTWSRDRGRSVVLDQEFSTAVMELPKHGSFKLEARDTSKRPSFDDHQLIHDSFQPRRPPPAFTRFANVGVKKEWWAKLWSHHEDEYVEVYVPVNCSD